MLTQEVIAPREELFTAVTLESPIFCADKRSAVGEAEEFIHLLGGAANTPFNIAVVKEVHEPNSLTSTLGEEVITGIKEMKSVGLNPGIHSDTISENGKSFQLDRADGVIGCKYLQFRAAISKHLVEERESTIVKVQALFPDLFTSKEDTATAYAVIDAHERLLSKDSFFTTGRDVATQAAEEGAVTMLVDGSDDTPVNEGIINERENTSFKTTSASKADLGAYNHDSWANRAIFAKMRDKYPYEERQFAIAEAIDAAATMAVLGVEHLEVRN